MRDRSLDEFSCVSGVYALIDPRTGLVMYVGQAANIKSRYKQHCGNRSPTNPRVGRWIDDLKSAGIIPRLVMVEKCRRPRKDKIEIAEIARLRKIGQCELNFFAGGQPTRRKKLKAKRSGPGGHWANFDPDNPDETMLTVERLFRALYIPRRPHGKLVQQPEYFI